MSSERMSRTCSTGAASQSATARRPAAVGPETVRTGPSVLASLLVGRMRPWSVSVSSARYTRGRRQLQTRPTSPPARRARTSDHPWAGASSSRPSDPLDE